MDNLKEMGIPDYLTCLLRNLYAGQEATVRTGHGTTDWFQIGKGFGIVNKAEIDVFLELSCFFDDPADVGNLTSGSSAFSKTSLNIRKFTVHILLKPVMYMGSKITADGDCSHEIKRHLLLRRKVMTNLDSLLKSRDITVATKVHRVKAMVFPVVMYGCES